MKFTRRSFLGSAVAMAPGLLLPGVSASEPARRSARPQPGDWEAIRRLYPLPQDRHYLNTGGLGPAPYPVMERYQRRTWDLQKQSEHGHQLIEEARIPVARFFGVQPQEICFTRNATEGNATIASGLRLVSGDEIIMDAHAHPGGAIPWMTRQKEHGVRVRLFEPHAEDPGTILDRIDGLITPRTRVIQISHVTAPTGILLPAEQIAQLAAERDIWFHIDGAQSAGMLPVGLASIGCDSYATSGHKWLGAPHGTGVLFVREDRLGDVVPSESGAYSDSVFVLPDEFDYYAGARRFEPGTRNAPLVDALSAATAFMSDIGMDAVRARGAELVQNLRSKLEAIDSIEILTPRNPAMSGSILTFRSTLMPWNELNQALSSRHNLRLRVVTERNLNAIRASLHVFNLESDCDRIAHGVADVLKTC